MPAGTCRATDSEGRASWLAAFNFPHWHRDSRAAPPELAGSIVPSSHAPNAQPQRVTANINCRIFPGRTVEETQAEIARVLNNPAITITTVGAPDPTSPPPPLSGGFELPVCRL